MEIRINPRMFKSEPMRRCTLGECQAACCLYGVWIDRIEASQIRENASLIAPHMEADNRDPGDWFDGREEPDENAISGWTVHSTVLPDPAHYGETACIFLRKDHLCALQVAANANALPPWNFKPFYCILHPLDLDEQGRITLDETELMLDEPGSCLRPAEQPIPLIVTFEPELHYLLGETGYQRLLDGNHPSAPTQSKPFPEEIMTHLITTLGPKSAQEIGVILPHEHVFVDLRTWDQPGYGEGQPEQVIALMGPELRKAQQAGVTALVECSTVGVGRRADILKAVSDATGFPIVAPTGVYREPWIPDWVHEATEDHLAAWMQGELEGEIENSGVQAGFIKLSAGDDGITRTESKVLRAATRAAIATGAVIGSHTIRGRVVREQLDIIEAGGGSPERFIWIHTQAEPDFALHLEMAKRGAWLEYDSIGDPKDDAQFIEWILKLLEADFAQQILLSHDRGWYDPAQPGGGTPRPFDDLTMRFLPKLQAAGVSEATIRQLTCENPFRAFAR